MQFAVAIPIKTKLSLYKKSHKSGIPINILEEVYLRGYNTWNESFKGSRETFAFDRVNSFISEGFARQVDKDLTERYETAETQSKNKDNSSSRFDGTDSVRKVYTRDTPGQKTIKTLKKTVREQYE